MIVSREFVDVNFKKNRKLCGSNFETVIILKVKSINRSMISEYVIKSHVIKRNSNAKQMRQKRK